MRRTYGYEALTLPNVAVASTRTSLANDATSWALLCVYTAGESSRGYDALRSLHHSPFFTPLFETS
jgi:hypothetical protein